MKLFLRMALVFCFVVSSAGVFANEINMYGDYQTTLQTYVNEEGQVNYSALQKNRKGLDRFVEQLGALSHDEFDQWTNEQKIAFWLNAYNALTLKVIIDHYPIKASLFKSIVYPRNSIRHISGVWDKLKFTVMGQEMTLNHIEHGILRKEFSDEPRVHMALVCASIGCPFLRMEAYRGDVLDSQLQEQGEKFLQYERNFRMDSSKKKLYISKIFEWFGDDFKHKYGQDDAVLTFIKNHISLEKRKELEAQTYSLGYSDYNWGLNEN